MWVWNSFSIKFLLFTTSKESMCLVKFKGYFIPQLSVVSMSIYKRLHILKVGVL